MIKTFKEFIDEDAEGLASLDSTPGMDVIKAPDTLGDINNFYNGDVGSGDKFTTDCKCKKKKKCSCKQ